jgi:hypothetical protein
MGMEGKEVSSSFLQKRTKKSAFILGMGGGLAAACCMSKKVFFSFLYWKKNGLACFV